MKKKTLTVGTIPKSNRIIVEIEGKSVILYITTHFPGLVQAFQSNVELLKSVMHNHSLSRLGTGISIKRGAVKISYT